jgi:hypothetical protein
MQVINDGVLRILVPDKGYKLVNKESGFISSKVYLCLADSPDNYTEVVDEKYIPMDYVVDLEDFKQSTNDVLDTVMTAIDEMFFMFEPLLTALPMVMSELEEAVVSPMAKLYFLMVQRGLKTIDEIPVKFKEDVIKLMNN